MGGLGPLDAPDGKNLRVKLVGQPTEHCPPAPGFARERPGFVGPGREESCERPASDPVHLDWQCCPMGDGWRH